jgi:hypothetical protein
MNRTELAVERKVAEADKQKNTFEESHTNIRDPEESRASAKRVTMSPLKLGHNRKWEQWNRNYEDVLAFTKEHGHLKLPSNKHETRRLATWLFLQPRRANIPDCQRDKLKALEQYRDMRPREEKERAAWYEMYKNLLAFHKENGHFVVPIKVDTSLHKWIMYQHHRQKIGKLPGERRKMPEEIDFEFQCNQKRTTKRKFSAQQKQQWETMFTQLVEFHQSHKHCNVPYNYDENRTLGHWVSKQRGDFKKGDMDDVRKLRLDKWDFTWTIERGHRGSGLCNRASGQSK